MPELTAFQIWEAARVPNSAYPWAKAAWEAHADENKLLRAEIEAQKVSKETYVAEWMTRLQDREQLLQHYREEAVIAKETISKLLQRVRDLDEQQLRA